MRDTRHVRLLRRFHVSEEHNRVFFLWTECPFVIFAIFVKTPCFRQGAKAPFAKGKFCPPDRRQKRYKQLDHGMSSRDHPRIFQEFVFMLPFPPTNQARKKSTKINFMGPEIARWGGGLPREDIPDPWGVHKNFVQKQFVLIFRPQTKQRPPLSLPASSFLLESLSWSMMPMLTRRSNR